MTSLLQILYAWLCLFALLVDLKKNLKLFQQIKPVPLEHLNVRSHICEDSNTPMNEALPANTCSHPTDNPVAVSRAAPAHFFAAVVTGLERISIMPQVRTLKACLLADRHRVEPIFRFVRVEILSRIGSF